MAAQLVGVGDAELEVSVWGSGEPVVFVQTGLMADEMRPLAEAEALEDGYRKIVYHRRGYLASSPATGAASIERDAADCRSLLTAISVPRAHIVGFSYSGAVGLQLAANAPACTHTLTLLEPPPLHTPSATQFRAVNDRLLRTRRERGPAAALDEFLTIAIGNDWRQVAERRLPGAVAQMQRDAATFFDADLPALLEWQFGAADASHVRCPVMHIGGSDSGAWFAEVRDLIRQWLPHTDDVVLQGADHSLVLTHAEEIADVLLAFLRRHAI